MLLSLTTVVSFTKNKNYFVTVVGQKLQTMRLLETSRLYPTHITYTASVLKHHLLQICKIHPY
jgi:hypothetical protein